MRRIGILLGSTRSKGNGHGLERWLIGRLSNFGIASSTGFELIHVYPNAPMHPLGPVVEDTIPAIVNPELDNSYESSKTKEWSKLISSCHAFVVLTPQHNWGYPGDLKNAIDHLYHEWKGKPVMIVTYGGHGGDKCAQQLKQVFAGLRMKVVEESVAISFPSEIIRGSARISPELFPEGLREGEVEKIDLFPTFLQEVDGKVAQVVEQFLQAINTITTETK